MRARPDSACASNVPQITLVHTVPAAITPPLHSAVSAAAAVTVKAQPAHWLHNTVLFLLDGF